MSKQLERESSLREIRIRQDVNGNFGVFELESEGYEDPVITGCSIHYAIECAERTLLNLPISQTQF
jgi:hypothetical protein